MPLSETGRLRLAPSVVADGWPLRWAAERFQVSPGPHAGADRAADRQAARGRAAWPESLYRAPGAGAGAGALRLPATGSPGPASRVPNLSGQNN